MSLVAAGCAGGDDRDSARPRVVAAFFPLAEAARLVAGDRYDVLDLTPSGVEPHDLELSSGDIDALLDADVVVLLGGGFQPAVEDVAEDRDGTTVTIDVDGDPHVWLDPVAYADIVDEVAAALGADAEPIREELEALDERYRSRLAPCAGEVLVVSHEAFGAVADAYDLRQEAISGLVPGEEPDPARLDELAELVRREGITTIFAEPSLSARAAETLAREAGAEVATLDPLESAPANGATYVEAMDANLEVLAAGLGC